MTLARRLRQATKADHHRVDHHPALASLLSPQLDMARYGAGLAALYPAIAGLERALTHTVGGDPGHYALILREPLLRHDIRRLGQTVPSAWAFTVPVNTYERVGMLYVLEGSRLGGHFIGRHAQRMLGEQVPCCFFTDMPLTPHAWAAFWHYAEVACPEHAWPDAVRGARQAFGEFIQALTAALPADPVTPTPAPIE